LKKYLQSYWFRSAAYSLLQRFSLTLFGFANFLILVRLLDTPQMGTWALFLIVTTIFETNKNALLRNAHVRYVSMAVAGEEKAAIASTSFVINTAASLLFILVILLLGLPLERLLNAGSQFTPMLLAFIPGVICMIFFSHFEAIQQSHFQFSGIFWGGLVKQIVFFACLLYVYLTNTLPELYWLGIFQSVSIAAGTVVLFFSSRKFLLFRFTPQKLWLQKLLSYGGYIFGSGVLSSIYSNLDQLMTATFIPAAVAYYSTARRINGFIDMPTYAAAEVAFPKLAKASFDEGADKVKIMFEKMVAVLLCIIIPPGILVILFAGTVMDLITAGKYTAAAPVLQVFIFASILGVIQHQAGTTLYSIGKSKLCFYRNCVTLFLNLVCAWAGIYFFGFYGAAAGTFIACIITTLLWYFTMKKEIGAGFPSIIKYCILFYKTAVSNAGELIKRAKGSSIQ
jgi:lipopolysaccharide exporter